MTNQIENPDHCQVLDESPQDAIPIPEIVTQEIYEALTHEGELALFQDKTGDLLSGGASVIDILEKHRSELDPNITPLLKKENINTFGHIINEFLREAHTLLESTAFSEEVSPEQKMDLLCTLLEKALKQSIEKAINQQGVMIIMEQENFDYEKALTKITDFSYSQLIKNYRIDLYQDSKHEGQKSGARIVLNYVQKTKELLPAELQAYFENKEFRKALGHNLNEFLRRVDESLPFGENPTDEFSGRFYQWLGSEVLCISQQKLTKMMQSEELGLKEILKACIKRAFEKTIQEFKIEEANELA